jgi:hypothetical protein
MDQQVMAQWAWVSKNPGSREDYGVLAASDRQGQIGGFVGEYVAGVPSSTVRGDAPMAPPWVTFGSHPTSAGRPVISISVQDPWRGQDQAGRAIWPQRFFLCWYDDVAGAQASYRALWDAVEPVELPRPDGQPVPLAIRPQPANDIIAAISEIGFQRAAAIAAALLDDPVAVAVTGTADLRLQDPAAALDRLAVLDAVAALLPYGFRADLSASSAVDNTVAPRMRLVLADYANDNQHAAPLRGMPVLPRSEIARDYLAMLLEKERWEKLDAVLAHLRAATDACSFSRPEQARVILDGLKRRSHKIRAAETGAEGLKESRVFFDDPPAEVAQMWRSPQLGEEKRGELQGKLVRPLLDSDDEHAAEVLRQHWNVVQDEVITQVNRRLDDGATSWAVRSLKVAESLAPPETADRLLMMLLVPRPDDPRGSWPRGIETRAMLLRQRRVPVPGDFVMTCLALRGGQASGWQGRLVRELLSSEIAGDPTADRAAAWATWLCQPAAEGSPSDWVAALGYTLGPASGHEVHDSVRSLIQPDAVWAAIALRLATHNERLGAVLEIPGLVDDFVDAAVRTAAQPGQESTRQALAIAVGVGLWGSGLAPGTIAAVDAARLLLGYTPRNFPHDRSQRECDLYNEGLNQVLRLPSVQKLDPSLVTRFFDQVVPINAPQRLSDGAVWLLAAWSKDEQLAVTLAGYAAVPEVTKVLRRYRRLDYEFWSRLVALQPDLRHTLAIPLLWGAVEQAIENPAAVLRRYTDEQTGATGSKLALAMYRAWRSKMSPAQIIEVIGNASVDGETLMDKVDHLGLDDVLREFEFLLAHPARDTQDDPAAAEIRQTRAEDILFKLWELICAGALGENYGVEFWRFLDERLRDEERARKRVRRRLRRPFRPFARPRPYSLARPVHVAAPREQAAAARHSPDHAGGLAAGPYGQPSAVPAAPPHAAAPKAPQAVTLPRPEGARAGAHQAATQPTPHRWPPARWFGRGGNREVGGQGTRGAP